MDTEIAILPFESRDFEEALELWKRTPGMGISAADSREAISAFLDVNPGLSLAAKDGEALIGTVLCGSDGRRGYLYHLAVDTSYRRRGIGNALVAACLERLRNHGIDKCHLFVISTNDAGAAFWESAGWAKRRDILVFSKAT